VVKWGMVLVVAAEESVDLGSVRESSPGVAGGHGSRCGRRARASSSRPEGTFAGEGRRCSKLTTVQPAIDLLREHSGKIHLVLLDLTIPGASSQEVLAEAARVRPDLKVIVTSAYSEEVAATRPERAKHSRFHSQAVPTRGSGEYSLQNPVLVRKE